MEGNLYNILNEILGSKKEPETKLTPTQFEEIVKTFNMKCVYSVSILNGVKCIVENWSSKTNQFAKISKIYPFSINNLRLINREVRLQLLNNLLSDAIFDEKYEDAAELRDIIIALS